jgi:hypothetical protein
MGLNVAKKNTRDATPLLPIFLQNSKQTQPPPSPHNPRFPKNPQHKFTTVIDFYDPNKLFGLRKMP